MWMNLISSGLFIRNHKALFAAPILRVFIFLAAKVFFILSEPSIMNSMRIYNCEHLHRLRD